VNRGKFERVKEFCKEDVIVLQEINWKDEIMADLKKGWGGEISFNNGDGRMGRGVAILVRKEKDIEVKQIYDDRKGKCIAVEIRYENRTFILVNVQLHLMKKKKRRNTLAL